MKTTLHHTTCNIAPNKLELVLELFEMLGCTLSYRKADERWAMVEQKPLHFDIQIIETDQAPIDIHTKLNTHIAFVSEDPKAVIGKIKAWAKEKNLEFLHDEWYKEAMWFDLPEVFTNFVIEIMDVNIGKE